MTEILRDSPKGVPLARLLLAHGAGAPMDSDFMNQIAEGLSAEGVEVWRFEFPYMADRRKDGRKRPPNRQPVLLDTWREVIEQGRKSLPAGCPLVIGGKSLGGRMASMVADEQGPDGLICLGYPFHPPGKPDRLRVEHFANLKTPCLILQGSRDALGNREQVPAYPLSPAIRVHWLEDGDHDFKPRVRSGYRHSQHLGTAVAQAVTFMERIKRIKS